MMVWMLENLLLYGVVAVICVAVSRFVVRGYLEPKRAKEAEEWRVAGKALRSIPRWDRMLNVFVTFAIGAAVRLLVGGWRDVDPIFRQYVPWYGIYEVLQTGVLFSSLGLALNGVTFPRTRRRVVLLVLAVLELAFVIHLADAYSFWGHGMSLLACVRGFAKRCYADAVGTMFLAVCFVWTVPLVLCMKPFRRDLTHGGLTCARYLGNVIRLVGWFGLLGLLIYEMLILMWLNLVCLK